MIRNKKRNSRNLILILFGLFTILFLSSNVLACTNCNPAAIFCQYDANCNSHTDDSELLTAVNNWISNSLSQGNLLVILGTWVQNLNFSIPPQQNKTDAEIQADYNSYFTLNSKVKSHSIDTITDKNQFWTYIYSLERNGRIDIARPDLTTDPSCSGGFAFYTGSPAMPERYTIARFAHAVWLDKNNLVNWNLNDYTDSELEMIFTHKTDANGVARGYYYELQVIPYSPSDDYSFTKNFIAATKEQTAFNIIKGIRYYEHGSHGQGKDSCIFLQDSLTEGIARYGCTSMSQVAVPLLLNLNLPAFVTSNPRTNNYFVPAHSGVLISGVGLIGHGDFIYSYRAGIDKGNITDDKVIIPWNYFVNNIQPASCCYNVDQCNTALKAWGVANNCILC